MIATQVAMSDSPEEAGNDPRFEALSEKTDS